MRRLSPSLALLSESKQEAALMHSFRQLEEQQQTLPKNFSRIKIVDKKRPVIFYIHDGATTAHELTPLANQFDSLNMNHCFLCLPWHGGRTNSPANLNQFNPIDALQKVIDMYQLLCEHFIEVNVVGVSTGALLAMLMTINAKLKRQPAQMILISPYVSQFRSNETLLTAADILTCFNFCCCGAVDSLIRYTTGHTVNLSRQTFWFQKHEQTDGHTEVPLSLVSKEGDLMSTLHLNVIREQCPKDLNVHVFINRSDIYIPAANAKQVVQAFFADCNLSLHDIDYPNRHCIIPEVIKDASIVKQMRTVLAGTEHQTISSMTNYSLQ